MVALINLILKYIGTKNINILKRNCHVGINVVFLEMILNQCLYVWLYVLLYTIVDFKSSLELVLYVWFISTLNKALNWIEFVHTFNIVSIICRSLDQFCVRKVQINFSQDFLLMYGNLQSVSFKGCFFLKIYFYEDVNQIYYTSIFNNC
jgi:hypothetical protein